MGEIKSTLNAHTEYLQFISSEMKQMNANFVAYNKQLEIYINRSEILERSNADHESEVNKRLQPIEKHVVQVSLIGKLSLLFIGAPAAIYYVVQLFRLMTGKI